MRWATGALALTPVVLVFADWDDAAMRWLSPAGPAAVLVALLTGRGRRPLFSVAAAVSALAAPDHSLAALAAGAAMLLAVAEPGSPLPERLPAWQRLSPWLSGLIGAVAGMAFNSPYTPGGLTAVVVGGGLGLLVRGNSRTVALQREAELWQQRSRAGEEQARWLRQRTALARELHDVLGHQVTAMVVQSEAGLVGDPQAALHRIGDLGRQALTELDAVVGHLRDPALPLQPGAPLSLLDIDELLAGPLRRQGTEVSVDVDPLPELDQDGVLTVYRIAQEALTNVTRHARASTVWVRVQRVPGAGLNDGGAGTDGGDEVRLRIEDDGVGPPTGTGPRRGSGLIGIAERVQGRGGTWALGPRPGGGTLVEARIPLRPKECSAEHAAGSSLGIPPDSPHSSPPGGPRSSPAARGGR